MYVVYKLDTIRNKVKIVNHAYDDDQALKIVRSEADNFATKKSRKVFDQTSSTIETTGVHTTYALRESKKNVNTIDVYETSIIKKKGWIANGVETTQRKIAQFSFTKYEQKLVCRKCGSESLDTDKKSSNLLENIKSNDYNREGKQVLSINNRELLTELKKNNMFRESQKNNNTRRNTLTSLGDNGTLIY